MLGGSKADIQRQDSELKKYGLLTLGIVIVGITLTAGVTAAYLIAAVAGLSAAILYPHNIEEWFNAHRMLLIGSLVGFFIGGATLGPITMVLGGFLGYLVEQPASLVVHAANKTVDAYQKVSNGVSQVTELPNNAWNSLKSGLEKSYRYFAGNETTAAKPEVKEAPKKDEPKIVEPKTEIKAVPSSLSAPLSEVMPKPMVVKKKTDTVSPKDKAVPLPAIKRTQTIKRIRRPVAKAATAKPETVAPPSTQSLWQSFCGYFMATPKVTSEEVLNSKSPTSLPLKNQLSRPKKPLLQPGTTQRRHRPILTIM